MVGPGSSSRDTHTVLLPEERDDALPSGDDVTAINPGDPMRSLTNMDAATDQLSPPQYLGRRVFAAGLAGVGLLNIPAFAWSANAMNAKPPPSKAPAGSVRQFGFLRRRPDLTQGEFRRYWIEQHGPKGRVVLPHAGATAYIQNHRIDGGLRGLTEAPFDGASEAWFHDIAQAKALRRSPEFQRVIAPDMPNFLDPSGALALSGKSYPIVEGSPIGRDDALGKALVLVAPRQAIRLSEARLVETIGSAIVTIAPRQAAITLLAESDQTAANSYAAVLEVWWENAAALDRNWASGGDAFLGTAGPVIDVGSSAAMRVDEVRMVWPPIAATD